MALKKVLLSGFGVVSTVSALCYMPNGTVTGPESTLRECGAAQYSNCCFDWEECTPNGYCLGRGDYYREYCTDPTWQTDKCGNLCLDDQGFSLGTILTVCEDGSFCCGYENQECCDNGEGQKIDGKGQVIKKTTTISSSKTTKSSTTSTIPTPTPTNAKTSQLGASPDASPTQSPTTDATSASNTDPQSSSTTEKSNTGLSAGAKAGIGIGIALGVVALAIFVFLYFRERKRRLNQGGAAAISENTYAYHEGGEDAPQVRTHSMAHSMPIDPRAAAINTGLYAAPAVEKYGYVSHGRGVQELPAGTGHGDGFRRESHGSETQQSAQSELSQGLR